MSEFIQELKFTFYNIAKNFQSETELRIPFIIAVIGMMLNDLAFIVIWYYFGVVAEGLNGWTAMDMFGVIGFATFGFGLAFTTFGGVRYLPDVVQTANLDKYFMNPKNILLRVSTMHFDSSAMGDTVFGAIVLGIWMYYTNFVDGKFVITILSILALSISAAIYMYSFSLISNSIAFYFLDSRSLAQGLWELIGTPSFFHGGAFQGALRKIFLFIIPAMLLGSYPVEVIKGGEWEKVIYIFLFSLLWLFVSIKFFYFSLKKYESSNFINFG